MGVCGCGCVCVCVADTPKNFLLDLFSVLLLLLCRPRQWVRIFNGDFWGQLGGGGGWTQPGGFENNCHTMKFSTRHEHIVTKFYGFNRKGCVSRDLFTQFYESQINQPIIRPQLTFLFYNI